MPESVRDKAVAAALDAVAADQGVSREAAAYSWLMAHPAGIVPIVGSQRAERINDAIGHKRAVDANRLVCGAGRGAGRSAAIIGAGGE